MDLGRLGNLILLFSKTRKACCCIFSVEKVHLKWEIQLSLGITAPSSQIEGSAIGTGMEIQIEAYQTLSRLFLQTVPLPCSSSLHPLPEKCFWRQTFAKVGGLGRRVICSEGDMGWGRCLLYHRGPSLPCMTGLSPPSQGLRNHV